MQNYALSSKMRERTLAMTTTLALLVFFIVTPSPVNANRMVVDVFPFSNSKTYNDGVWSTTISLNQSLDIYAQVSYVQSGTVPPSTFVWYINGVFVKSDTIGSSTLTFVPKALGTYNITVTVNGETNSELVIVTVIAEQPSFTFVTPWVWESPPNLTIESPINGTYNGVVRLNFTFEAPKNWFNNQSGYWNDFNLKNTAIEQKLISVTYTLDGCSTTIPVDNNLCLPYKGSIELCNITEGKHQLIVYGNATGVYRSFRGFFVQTQIYDVNKAIIYFSFIQEPIPTPTISPASQMGQVFNIGIVLMVVSLVIGCLLKVRRNRKNY